MKANSSSHFCEHKSTVARTSHGVCYPDDRSLSHSSLMQLPQHLTATLGQGMSAAKTASPESHAGVGTYTGSKEAILSLWCNALLPWYSYQN